MQVLAEHLQMVLVPAQMVVMVDKTQVEAEVDAHNTILPMVNMVYLVVVVLAMPRIGGADHLWMNGLYDSLSIVFIFPLIILLGAGGAITGKRAKGICTFFGDISYPVYITLYPLIYIYTGWVADKKLSIQQAYPVALLVFVASIVLAYVCLKFYDEPVRAWLKKRVMAKG
jgi:peptidoglycan/LPS O-acetylase OafA/YrhL